MTAAMNGANERANEIFRNGVIPYLDIPRVIEATMEAHKSDLNMTPQLQDIVDIDVWARAKVDEVAKKLSVVLA